MSPHVTPESLGHPETGQEDDATTRRPRGVTVFKPTTPHVEAAYVAGDEEMLKALARVFGGEYVPEHGGENRNVIPASVRVPTLTGLQHAFLNRDVILRYLDSNRVEVWTIEDFEKVWKPARRSR